ncbi:DNA repair protein RecO [Patescibacteria group bacterium]|nr:DNA repair protein RecO [Patescibacteria group bacterium]
MRTCKAEGIIIKRTNLGEADRLLTLFTKQMGKIQVKALGVRRIYSRRAPEAPVQIHVFIALYQGKGMPILTEIEPLRDFRNIKNRLDRIGLAYHICELIDRLCAYNQENTEVFNLLKQTLDRLSGDNIKTLIHEFELGLLTRLGFYSPQHRHDQSLNTQQLIEDILERKLRTRQILPLFNADYPR